MGEDFGKKDLEKINNQQYVDLLRDFQEFSKENENPSEIVLKKRGFYGWVTKLPGDSLEKQYENAIYATEQIIGLLDKYGSPEKIPRDEYAEALSRTEDHREKNGKKPSGATIEDLLSTEKKESLDMMKRGVNADELKDTLLKINKNVDLSDEENKGDEIPEESETSNEQRYTGLEEAAEYFTENPTCSRKDLKERGYLKPLTVKYGNSLDRVAESLGIKQKREQEMRKRSNFSKQEIKQKREQALKKCAENINITIDGLAKKLDVSVGTLYNRIFDGGINDLKKEASKFAAREFEGVLDEEDPQESLEFFRYRSGIENLIENQYDGSVDKFFVGLELEGHKRPGKDEIRERIYSTLEDGPATVKEMHKNISKANENIPFARVMSNIHWMEDLEKMEDGRYKRETESIESIDSFGELYEELGAIDPEIGEDETVDGYRDRIMSQVEEIGDKTDLEEADEKLIVRAIELGLEEESLEEVANELEEDYRERFEERIDFLKERFSVGE